MSSLTNRLLGIAAIVIGLLVAVRMLWLLPPLLLIGGGLVFYRYQKVLGRTDRALQGALWGVGLGIGLLTSLLFPAVFVLAGASLLLRGREAQIDAQLRGWWKVLAIGRQAKAIAAAVTRSETPNGKK